MSILNDYTDRVLEYTDTPEIFARISSYYLLSSTLGEFYRNTTVPIGVQRPNIWVILSSIPGRMRRSTVQRKAYNIYKKVHEDYNYNTILEDGSPQGIIDAIQEEYNSYTIQSTELGGVLVRCQRNNSYSQGVFQTWSKLYYGEGGVEHFSTRSGNTNPRVLRENLYVTMLGGLQTPNLYFKPQMVNQGIMRRLLIVYVEKNERYLDPINQDRDQIQMDDIINALIEKRESRLRSNEIVVRLDPQATQIINKYSQDSARELDNNPSMWTIFAQSNWEQLMKLATLQAVDECEPISGIVIVNGNHVEQVEPLVNEIYERIKPIIENLGDDTPTRSRRNDFERVLYIIRKKGYATRSILYNNLRWAPNDAEQIISAMITAELIEIKTIKPRHSKPHPVYFEKGNMPSYVEENLYTQVVEESSEII